MELPTQHLLRYGVVYGFSQQYLCLVSLCLWIISNDRNFSGQGWAFDLSLSVEIKVSCDLEF